MQTHNVRMIQKLHDADLALEAKRDEPGIAVCQRGIPLCGAFAEIGQAQSTHMFGHRLGYDLGGSQLAGEAMAHDTDARATSVPDRLAQMPGPDVRLPATSRIGRVGARIRDLGVAFGVVRTSAFVDHRGKPLVLRAGGRRLETMPDSEGAIAVRD